MMTVDKESTAVVRSFMMIGNKSSKAIVKKMLEERPESPDEWVTFLERFDADYLDRNYGEFMKTLENINVWIHYFRCKDMIERM